MSIGARRLTGMGRLRRVFQSAITKIKPVRPRKRAAAKARRADHGTPAAVAGIESELRQRLQCCVAEAGPDANRSIVARVELANHLQKEGRLEEADAEYAEAFQRYRKLAGDSDSHLLVLQYTQAQSLLRRGRLNEAKAKLLEICAASRRVNGPCHPSTLAYLDSLAATLVRLGEREDAKTLLLTILAARRDTSIRGDHDATLSTAGVLVTSYLNDELWTEALPLQDAIVALLRTQRPEGDCEVLLASSLLAVMLVEAGETTRARRLLQGSVNQFAQTFGREHAETLRVFLLLGLVLERQDELLGARAVIERSFSLAKARLGEEHEITLRLGTKLACLLLRCNEHSEARAVLMDVLPVAERTLGRESSTTLTNLNNLAVAIWKQGQHKLAQTLAEEVLRRHVSAHGEEHADTRQARRQLILMTTELDKCARRAAATGLDSEFEWERESAIRDAAVIVRLRGIHKPGWKQ